jgi:Replication protein A interacting C-terminal
MTPKVATASAPARKITPIASKTWKENLRRACLERARRGRKKLAENHHADSAIENENGLSVRCMVEDELRQRAIAIHSPCNEGQFQLEPYRDPTERMDALEESCTEVPKAHHFITEEELFELLAEVEQEIERNEALHLDEMIELARHESEYLQDQVSDFERWEESKQQYNSDSTIAVLCPLCHGENLIQTPDLSILCPNRMDGSCSMQLDNAVLTLHDLEARMRTAFEEHALYCHNYMCCQIQEGQLRATCSVCDTMMEIV